MSFFFLFRISNISYYWCVKSCVNASLTNENMWKILHRRTFLLHEENRWKKKLSSHLILPQIVFYLTYSVYLFIWSSWWTKPRMILWFCMYHFYRSDIQKIHIFTITKMYSKIISRIICVSSVETKFFFVNLDLIFNGLMI